MENICHAAVSTPGVFSGPGLLEALLRWSMEQEGDHPQGKKV